MRARTRPRSSQPTIDAYISGSTSSTTSTNGGISVIALHDLSPADQTTVTGGAASASASAGSIAISLAAADAGRNRDGDRDPDARELRGGTLRPTPPSDHRPSRSTPPAPRLRRRRLVVGVGALTRPPRSTAPRRLIWMARSALEHSNGAADLTITSRSTDTATASSSASGKGIVGDTTTRQRQRHPDRGGLSGSGAIADVSSDVTLQATRHPIQQRDRDGSPTAWSPGWTRATSPTRRPSRVTSARSARSTPGVTSRSRRRRFRRPKAPARSRATRSTRSTRATTR